MFAAIDHRISIEYGKVGDGPTHEYTHTYTPQIGAFVDYDASQIDE